VNRSLANALIVFDWNGTVMADADRAKHATNAVLRRRGLPELNADEFRAAFRLPMQLFLTRLGVAQDDRVAAEEEWNTHLGTHPAEPRAGAIEAFTQLAASGATLGVVSAASIHAVRADARACGLELLLHFIDGDVTDKTRHLRERGNGGRCLYVGDTAYDILCGRGAGYRTVAITDGYNHTNTLRAAEPDHIIDSLSDLAYLLAQRIGS
jgi:phosphoglycolate phosphatase-like HAD superfamily hydrolase